MALQSVFPTLVYSAPLMRRGLAAFNRQIAREIEQLTLDDRAGQHWSRDNYPGGYTSYGSASRMQDRSPTFAALERRLQRHVNRFAKELGFDTGARPLVMTDCWANVMPTGVVHSLHLHPLSTISGTYYVRTPRGCPGLKLEDPRLDRMMAAPPRHDAAGRRHSPWVTMPVRAGDIVLFESWLRHEVPPNRSSQERVSVSFNFNWF